MPKLMEKNDWIQTVANVGTAEGVWYDNVLSSGGVLPVSVPEKGMYQIIFVKIGDGTAPSPVGRKSAKDFIGYSRKYHPEWHTTEEAMKVLREGEE